MKTKIGESHDGSCKRVLERLLAAMPEDPERFRGCCDAISDWEGLLDCAGQHGIEGALLDAVNALGIRLPSPVGERAAHQQVCERLGQSRLHATLAEAVGALERAGVSAVALKGPVMAERLYGDAFLRSSTDLDFLVVDAELDRAIAALDALGYRAETGLKGLRWRRDGHHVPLYRPGFPPIELHFYVYRAFGAAIPAEDFLARASLYRTRQGWETRVLSPEDEFIELAIHAVAHCYMRLSWLYDVKLLIRRSPSLDWAVVAARARSLGLARPVSFTCDMLRQRLGVEIPEEAGLAPLRGLRGHAASVLLPPWPEHKLRAAPRMWAFQALLFDRPTAGAGYLWRNSTEIALILARRSFRRLLSR